MKIAVLMSGYLRSFNLNIDNFLKNIIQQHSVDFYIHITSNENIDDKYQNHKNIPKIDDIINKLQPKLLIVHDNLLFSNILNIPNKKINDLKNQHYKFYLLFQQLINMNNHKKNTYDIIIKFRPDTHFIETINWDQLNLDKYIYIPKDSKIDINKLHNLTDPYICDIFAIGNLENMQKYFNFFLHLDNLIEKYQNNISETLLYHYLNDFKFDYQSIEINYVMILSECNIFAITGDSGSGKSKLSNLLKKLFQDSFLLECDRYHKWERGDTNWLSYTHLNPEANFITKMNKDVFDLKIGKNIYQVDYDHQTGKFTDHEIIKNSNNIIVCGLHTLYLNDKYYNLKIFLDTDENLKVPWKIIRDFHHRRHHNITNIKENIEKRKKDYEAFIKPQMNYSDIIIRFYTNKFFSWDLLNTLNINDFIRQIEPNNYDIQLQLSINNKFYPIVNKLTHEINSKIQNLISNISFNNCFIDILFEKLEFITNLNDLKTICPQLSNLFQNNYYDIILIFIYYLVN